MQPRVPQSTSSAVAKRSGYRSRFEPVYDSRKRKIRGLWRRNERYYAQLRVALGNGSTAPRRIPLDATNLDEAKAGLERKRTEKRTGNLPASGYRPKFADFVAEYLDCAAFRQKKCGTQQNERQALARWNAHCGGVRVDKITAPIVHGFRENRLRTGLNPRTVNLDTVALRNVLKLARDRGFIAQLPDVRQLKQKPSPVRRLLTTAEVERLVSAAGGPSVRNGALFGLYVRFLALTGAREQEALGVRWSDIDAERGTVTIGSGGQSKNHRSRTVDFSRELQALVEQMESSRAPDSTWLFPSPQRGERDEHARTLRETLGHVREAAGLPSVGFHDLRHFFASQCVMAGIDFMTIASWLGHSDGGILVGRVYGHLVDAHKKAAANKLIFFPNTTP